MKLVMRAFSCRFKDSVSKYHVGQAWQTNGKQPWMPLLPHKASPESAASAVRDGNVEQSRSPAAHASSSGRGGQHNSETAAGRCLALKLGLRRCLHNAMEGW